MNDLCEEKLPVKQSLTGVMRGDTVGQTQGHAGCCTYKELNHTHWWVAATDSIKCGISCQVCKVKRMGKCLKHAFSLMASRGRLHWFQKQVRCKLMIKMSLLLTYGNRSKLEFSVLPKDTYRLQGLGMEPQSPWLRGAVHTYILQSEYSLWKVFSFSCHNLM